MQGGYKGLSGRQLAACAVVLLVGLWLNSGCDITTFGNLTTTGTSSGGGSSTTPTVPHLQNSVFTLAQSSFVQAQPDVAFFDTSSGSARRYLACWVEGATRDTLAVVKTQHLLLNPSGTVAASTLVTLTTTNISSVAAPALTVLEPSCITGVIVWQQKDVGASYNRIRSSCVFRSGNGLASFGPVKEVSTVSTTLDQTSPAIASAGTTLCLAVYLETNSTVGAPTLKGRFLDSQGNPFSGSTEVDIEHTAGNVDASTRPTVAFNRQLGEFLVVWGSGSAVSNNSGIRRAVVAADPTVSGPKLVNKDVVATGTSRIPRAPGAVYNPARNEYVAIWVEEGTNGYRKIVRQKLDSGAEPATSGAVSLSGDRPGADRPDVAFNSVLNQYLVVWPDVPAGSSSSTFDIRGRLLYYDANLDVTNGDEIDVATGTVNRTEPAVAFDPIEDNWLVLFTEDGRAIRGQRVKPAR